MTADDEKLQDMKLQIDETVTRFYKSKLENENSIKLDDLGDATLHALRDVLCGSSNYKQALPKVTSLYDNRTIAISLFPDTIYWCVISCKWNSFVLEGLGAYEWRSLNETDYYLDNAFVERIVNYIANTNISSQMQLGTSLQCMDGSNVYTPTNHIKVVVKQQSVYDKRGKMTREIAGALTTSTTKAMRKICDDVIKVENSQLFFPKSKDSGVIYMRTNRENGLKMQVKQSTGKHLNAVLCFLGWFRENLPKYVEERRLTLDNDEKCLFFKALRNVTQKGDSHLELLEFSDNVKAFITSDNNFTLSEEHTRNFSDIILMALSSNQQHVKAVAANYRQSKFAHNTSTVLTNQQTNASELSPNENCEPSRKRPTSNSELEAPAKKQKK
jgi:hypothetical protein